MDEPGLLRRRGLQKELSLPRRGNILSPSSQSPTLLSPCSPCSPCSPLLTLHPWRGRYLEPVALTCEEGLSGTRHAMSQGHQLKGSCFFSPGC
ncbi:unnamed protein product [Caretta caretta]